MPVDRAFDLYAKSARKKKYSKHQLGEGISNPSSKKAQTKDPLAPPPTKETTPPPTPAKEITLPTPVNQDPPAPVEQTPPAVLADLTPPASTDQTPAGRREEASREDLTSVVLNSAKDRLTKIIKHHCSREAIQETGSMAVDQVFNHAQNEVLSGVLTMSSGWRSSRTLAAQFEKKFSDQLGIAKAQHAEQLKMTEAKHAEKLKEVEESIPREAELARCAARLEEEKTQESPKISLATGIEGAREDGGVTVDQQLQEPQQDPPAAS
ncbi:uncharacterized protein LOC133806840 [Humulus lupulus]|uniref:uncharacterized protein LOC133806840 n=1 Tax=Humulus lupulus TaxID=3486 RepID=UPI002B40C62B|nr:uncharacterized protein LOC133806840 [Humulus lupulus]